MPDQNKQNGSSNVPAQGNSPSDQNANQPIPDFQAIDSSTVPAMSPPPTQTQDANTKTEENDKKDENPIKAVSMESVTPPPKKKFGGKRIIATILGMLLLVAGVGGGVYLTQQNQDIREKADNESPTGGVFIPDISTAPDNARFQYDHGCIYDDLASDIGGGAHQPYRDSGCGGGESPVYDCPQDTTPDWDKRTAVVCRGAGGCPTGNRVRADNNWNCGEGCIDHRVLIASCKPRSSIQCNKISAKREDGTWLTPPGVTNGNQVVQFNLASLKAGDKVNLCVSGHATGGQIDKAKFNINGTETEVTTKESDGSFCMQYTIPDNQEQFDITANVHHTVLGWNKK